MSGSTSGQPRVWSLWIYDRHCTLIYHADWSAFHNRTASTAAGTASIASATTSGATTSADGTATAPATGHGRSAVLPLAEQAKLVYGLVFSLRNMTRKLTPTATAATSSSSSAAQQDSLHSFSTSTYTLAHLQTPTNYTFVMLTDPVPPPTRRAPTGTGGAATFSGGGGIPATGGMTTTGVLAQITRGPWVEFVARNPGCLSLERQEYHEDSDDEDVDDVGDDSEHASAAGARAKRRADRRLARQKEQQRQRLTGIGKSVDSEAFRAAIERVLTQNKLNATRI